MTTYQIKANEHQEITLEKPGKYVIELVGEGASVEIKGIFQTQQKETCLLEVVIHHQAPHTKAETVMKGAAKDDSFIQFKGKIVIDQDCGDTQSFLTERVLLLSETARAEAVPDLEIKTDDVKCSHAASISSITDEHLFYLQSRGIEKAVAEQMIVDGFLEI
ncbi:MAG: SufD family Fe-S cluster assembly protein [Candidatus Pacebacteria bacterium]|jgi:Fe-S cluster assembly protein SufD|nr:SufD family Fe-S cluster assembly protein [Candidatus Paceibacterota bacterium]